MTGISRTRFEQVRNGGRQAERRARRYAALIRKAIEVLDDLADELERGLTERDRP